MNTTTNIIESSQWTFTQISTLIAASMTFFLQLFSSFKQGHFDSQCFGHRLMSLNIDSTKTSDEKTNKSEA